MEETEEKRTATENKGTLPLMFSRIQETGFSPKKLATKTASIIGLGGLGALVANMLVRLGVGHLILVDRDYVGRENLNRLGYGPEHVGKAKVDATKEQLEGFKEMRGPFSLQIEAYRADIIAWQKLKDVVKRSDLVFGCLDNLKARLELNHRVVAQDIPLVDGGTAPNGLRGRVDVVVPKQFPCLGCYYDNSTLTSFSSQGKMVESTCNLSLPTLMNIIASLQVDQGVRLLLEKTGVHPRIFVNLEEGIDFLKAEDVKRREDCKFCGSN